MAIATALTLALAGAQAVVGVSGAIAGARAQEAQARFDAKVADRNSKIAREQALADADDKRRRNAKQLSSIRAAYGANNLAFDGSALDFFEDQAAEGELAVARIIYKGEVRSQGFDIQSNISSAEAANASTAGILNAGSALVNAGSTALKVA